MTMDTLTGITGRSTYDQCVAHINAAVQDFMYDQEPTDISEGEIWVDMASALLVDASESVAREVCRCQIGFVPQDLERLWQQRKEVKKILERKRYKERAEAKKVQAAEAAAAAKAAEVQALRDRTCPTCFTVKAPAGGCNCL